jgi:hypothetical protein
VEERKTTILTDKQGQRILIKAGLSEHAQRYEKDVLANLARFKEALGEGRLTPLHTAFWYTTFSGALYALYGAHLTVESVKDLLHDYNYAFSVLNTSAVLPLFPDYIWNRILPRGRLFLKSRRQLRETMERWYNSPEATADAVSSLLPSEPVLIVRPLVDGCAKHCTNLPRAQRLFLRSWSLVQHVCERVVACRGSKLTSRSL